jgi:hypothetical protein
MDITMFEAQLRFPVICPECGKEVLSNMPLTAVREALCSDGSLALRSPCHDAQWAATPRELEQIREYFDVAGAEENMAAPTVKGY